MSWISRFLKDIRSLDKSAFSITTGFRAAFVIAPIIAGFALHQPAFLFATLGAIFLTNTEKAFYTIPSRILLVACFTEAASFGLGTLVATTSHLLSPILLGIEFLSLGRVQSGPLLVRSQQSFSLLERVCLVIQYNQPI
jgi:hypothetical protein